MRIILRFLALACLIAAGGFVVLRLLGRPALLVALRLFAAGIVFFALSAILDRLTRLEFLLTSSRAAGPDCVKTAVGDFELLGPVEGQATCLACRKTSAKTGLYYNKTMDVYYHPQCLARDHTG